MSPQEMLAAKDEELAMVKREILEVKRGHALDVLAVEMGKLFVRAVQLRDQAVIERDEVAMIEAARTIREHLRAWHEAAQHIQALTSWPDHGRR